MGVPPPPPSYTWLSSNTGQEAGTRDVATFQCREGGTDTCPGLMWKEGRAEEEKEESKRKGGTRRKIGEILEGREGESTEEKRGGGR